MIFAFFIFVMSGCIGSSKKEIPLANVRNPTFVQALNEYVRNIDIKKNNNITVSIEKTADTTFVSLINSLPDTRDAKLNGFLEFNKCNLYFIGSYPATNIYYIEEKTKAILIEDVKGKDLSRLRHVEPLFWELYFIGDSLVKSRPVDLR